MSEANDSDDLHQSKPRKIWSVEEDRALAGLIKKKGKKVWNEIAEELYVIAKTHKTGKQCRERHRNYLDPTLDVRGWKQEEKMTFWLLHMVYGNQWKLISQKMKDRNDITIKNRFYRVVRKALRNYKVARVPPSALAAPFKLYQTITVLEMLKSSYLPFINESFAKTKKEHKEKVILKLLKDCISTPLTIEEYEDLLIKAFKKQNSSLSFPCIITDSIEKNEDTRKLLEVLTAHETVFNPSITSSIITIKIQVLQPQSQVKTSQTQHPQPLPPLPPESYRVTAPQPRLFWNPAPTFNQYFPQMNPMMYAYYRPLPPPYFQGPMFAPPFKLKKE